MLSAIAAAPYATTQQSGTYSGYTSQGQYVTGTYVGTQQNKTVEYLAQQQNNARIESFSDEMSAALSRALMNVRRLALNEMLLEKGQSMEGIITVPLPNLYSLPNRYRFIIKIGDSVFEHDFPISSKYR